MDNPSRLHSISNLRAIGLMAGALVLMPAPLLAADATNVRATGTMPPTAVVDVPSQIVSDPPTLKADGTEMIVSSQTPVGLIANVPSQVALTSLELAAPQGVSSANVGAELSLMENGRALVGTSTTGGKAGDLSAGHHLAHVQARFYSLSPQPLPAGQYSVTTVLTVTSY
jgi:hypothetical protein